MKSVLLVPTALTLILNMESCPVTRPTEAASTNESREMEVASNDSIVQAADVDHPTDPTRTLPIEDLRRNVREIIRPRCGTCHTSTLTTAKPGAIRIFDLVRDDWSGMITREHFKGFKRRLRDLNESDGKMVSELIRTELSIRLQ